MTIIVALVLGEEFAGIVGMLMASQLPLLISVLIREYIASDEQDSIAILPEFPENRHPAA